MASLEELLAQKASLEKQILDAQREERSAAITQVKALMAQYGLTLADLGTRAAAAPKRSGSTGKVAPKYRDPTTGDTWTGRGLQPKWLRAALAAGRSLSDFTI
ncbi:H-NS family nucleoid-associated regulatory protein [Rubrivivax sp. RP6-9]|uniref:H-NS histone family protein n=1 Tax=Rubrivivax sp. RP6-9 TaxID=3415750 RepID=UPI003CC52E47